MPGFAPFQICMKSGEFEVRDALKRFIHALAPLGLDVEETGTIELVLAEALNNIVEHAYAGAEGKGHIEICCSRRQDGLIVRITDDGIMMPNGQMPIGALKPTDGALDEMPEGGFGWFLIQHLAKDVTYTRVGKQNHLNLRLAIGMV